MPDIIIGLLIRNSTARQIGNFRSEAQADLADRIKQRGCDVRIYDEQGTSGADLSKRRITQGMLDDLKRGEIHGLAAYDVKRLTRDEFGIDGATIARRIADAGGRFHTWDREYNLRLDDDLMQFQFQCFIAGIDWRNIRNTFWSGIFKKLEKEPHYMKTPLGYMTIADESGKKHIAKNPAHYSVMLELARLFDECGSLAEIVRTLNANGPERPKFRGRGGTSTHWHLYGLRYILNNTIYTGTFRRTAREQHSMVWEKFALDPATGKPKEFEHHRPDLAYWEPARVRRWQRKFAEPANARIRQGALKSRHPLLGMLECISCGQRMIGYGPNYACSATGMGKGRKGIACVRPQIIAETVVHQILRHELERAIGNVQDVAERARVELSERKPSEAQLRLAFLEERAVAINDLLFAKDAHLPSLLGKLKDVEAELAQLRTAVADEQDARLDDDELARTCDVLLSSPVNAFDALPIDKQARVYVLLFSGVRIEATGVAAGRRWRLERYTARLGEEVRVTENAPWATYPNPSTARRLGLERGKLVFEASPSSLTHISRHVYDAYPSLLRELAGVLGSSSTGA